MSHVNCHARSKQKRKKLRFKNLLKRIFVKRKAALVPPKPKGFTLKGMEAKKIAFPVPHGWTAGFDHQHCMRLNQRQKRKRQRQANSY